MKKLLLATVAVFAIFFVVSCSGDEESGSSVAAGGSCSVEGEESCSSDASQILVCSSSSWQAKKTCNLNFGQYCRQTASGSYSCTDTDNGNTTDPTSESTEPTETEPADDTEPANDSDPTDNIDPTDDTEPVDDSEPADDTEPADDSETPDLDCIPYEQEDDSPIETCAAVIECRDQCAGKCDGATCLHDCFNRGTTQAQNDFVNWQSCLSEYEYGEVCINAITACGEVGDMTYGLPYGHAIIDGNFEYILVPNEDLDGKYIDGYFVSGNFGTSGNIIAPSSGTNGTYAYAMTKDNVISLIQDYKNQSAKLNPYVSINIKASTPGTYSVGLGNDKIKIFINDWDYATDDVTCNHAFGYGYVEIEGSALAETYESGAKTLKIKGEVDLYSFKNAPMYVTDDGGHDISSTSMPACAVQ